MYGELNLDDLNSKNGISILFDFLEKHFLFDKLTKSLKKSLKI